MNLNRGFASDNNLGIHPEILKAIAQVNTGHCIAYGDDPFTESTIDKFREQFGDDIDVYLLFTGTASNVLAVRSAAESFNSIICAETSHLNMHECGGPENFSGCKLLTVPSENGKIYTRDIEHFLDACGDEHQSQPKVISISQSTELCTVYTRKELIDLCEFAHDNNLYVHMDGARLCNAAVHLDLSLKAITRDVGIDILSFGGTKNGMMIGESVIFFNRNLASNFKYIRKQGMQLSSKMRFISVQFDAFFSNDLWMENARHANKMAEILSHKLEALPGCTLAQKVESNGVFVRIPPGVIEELQRRSFFYIWDYQKSIARMMTSFDTEIEDINNLVQTLKSLLLQNC